MATEAPGTRPQAVALISGGKDSFLSLTHAIHNGYRIVALCNLHPPLPSQATSTTTTVIRPDDPVSLGASPASGSDELDSYMYQTIGHTVLPLYARALGLPLYRQPIVGKAVEVGLNYHPSSASSGADKATDETEDLFFLLSAVKRDFLGITAVTSGAILSSYQRTRVESVCRRLGLISLAYLWQLPQPSILSALSQLQWDARIVKVAALGMDDRWLWWNLADPTVQRRLAALQAKWGINVAGEGGEFESLVVATPGWKGRIMVRDEARRVVTEEEGGGAVWVQFDEATVETVNEEDAAQETWTRGLEEPSLLDEDFRAILPDTPTPFTSPESSPTPAPSPSPIWGQVFTHGSHKASTTATTHSSGAKTLTISNIVAETPTKLLDRLFSLLPSSAVLTSIHISLPTITLFPTLNAAYSPYFPLPLPPSRVCVASPGLENTTSSPLLLCHATAAISTAQPYQQTGLHVQSRSYWAPCNIGPYSQATQSPDGHWWDIAGQIPLVPSSMTLLPRNEGVEKTLVLALQHLVRIAAAVDPSAAVRGVVVHVNTAVAAVNDVIADAVVKTIERWSERMGMVEPVKVLIVGAMGLPMDAVLEVVGTVSTSRNPNAVMEITSYGGERCEDKGFDVSFDGADVVQDVVAYVDPDAIQTANAVVEMVQSGVRVVPVCGIWGSDGQRRSVAISKRVAKPRTGGYGGDGDSESE